MIYLIRVHTVDDNNNYSLVIGQIVNGQGVWAVVHVNTQDPQAWFDDPANLPTLQAAIASGTADERIEYRIRKIQYKEQRAQALIDLDTIINFTNPTNAQVVNAIKRLAEIQRMDLRATRYIFNKLEQLSNEPD